MQQTLQNVIINRQGINSIEFENGHIELPLSPGEENPFEILITNYGSPTHIHLSVSEELKGSITLLRNNPYVLQNEYISAVARISLEGRVFTEGKIYITAGYGSNKKGFPVYLGKPENKKRAVFPANEPDRDLDDPETIRPYDPSRRNYQEKTNASEIGKNQEHSGFSASFLKKLSFGSSNRASKKEARKETRNEVKKDSRNELRKTSRGKVGNEDKSSLYLAFAGLLSLIVLFALYFILPESLKFTMSLPLTLVYSILFIICTGYLLITIIENA